MIKMTIATDDQGNVIGAVQHDGPGATAAGGMRYGVSFAPGSTLHAVEVSPEHDMAKATDCKAFQESLKRYIPKGK